jgi:hypothetical protein
MTPIFIFTNQQDKTMSDLIINTTDTYKTKNGGKVRIYAVDAGGDYPVHGAIWFETLGAWLPAQWTIHGKMSTSGEELLNDLVKTSPYADWPIDAKVWAWIEGDNKKYPRYFSGISPKGQPMTWANGRTSWSAKGDLFDRSIWDYIELAE